MGKSWLGWIGAAVFAGALRTADLDQDGDADLAISTNRGVLEVLKNQGGAFPIDDSQHIPLENIGSLAGGDFDGDGDLDLAAGAALGGKRDRAAWLESDGKGNFALPREFPAGHSPTHLAAADCNGDGLLDLVTADAAGQSMFIHLKLGGAFLSAFKLTAGRNPRAALAGDLDGDVDLVTANYHSLDLTVFLNKFKPPIETAYRKTICTEAEFLEVSIEMEADARAGHLTKFIVPALPPRPDSLPPLFQNVRSFTLHQKILAKVFPDRFPGLNSESYDQLVGRRAARQYFAGDLFTLPEPSAACAKDPTADRLSCGAFGVCP